MWSDHSQGRAPAAAAGAMPPLPFPPPHCAALFDDAIRALTMCADAAAAAGSVTARTYAWGAAGALRHALVALANEGKVVPLGDPSTFDTRRVGGGELVGGAVGWDTVGGCLLPDGGSCTAHALWPATDITKGIWLRSDDTLRGLAVRGRVVEDASGSLHFEDDPTADRWPAPPAAHDLGRDLVRDGPTDINRTPALAAALELALVSGSWCHVDSGKRWFADRAGARAILRMMGSPFTLPEGAAARLNGLVDREALVLVERLGWRHLPTPRLG